MKVVLYICGKFYSTMCMCVCYRISVTRLLTVSETALLCCASDCQWVRSVGLSARARAASTMEHECVMMSLGEGRGYIINWILGTSVV